MAPGMRQVPLRVALAGAGGPGGPLSRAALGATRAGQRERASEGARKDSALALRVRGSARERDRERGRDRDKGGDWERDRRAALALRRPSRGAPRSAGGGGGAGGGGSSAIGSLSVSAQSDGLDSRTPRRDLGPSLSTDAGSSFDAGWGQGRAYPASAQGSNWEGGADGPPSQPRVPEGNPDSTMAPLLSDPELQALLSYSPQQEFPSQEPPRSERAGPANGYAHASTGGPPPREEGQSGEGPNPLSSWPDWPWGFLARTRGGVDAEGVTPGARPSPHDLLNRLAKLSGAAAPEGPSEGEGAGASGGAAGPALDRSLSGSLYAGPTAGDAKKQQPFKWGLPGMQQGRGRGRGGPQPSDGLDPSLAGQWYAGPAPPSTPPPTSGQGQRGGQRGARPGAGAGARAGAGRGAVAQRPEESATDAGLEIDVSQYLYAAPPDLAPKGGYSQGRATSGAPTSPPLASRGSRYSPLQGSEGGAGETGPSNRGAAGAGGPGLAGGARAPADYLGMEEPGGHEWALSTPLHSDLVAAKEEEQGRARKGGSGGGTGAAGGAAGSANAGGGGGSKAGGVGGKLQGLVLELMRFALRSGHAPGTLPTAEELRAANRQDLEAAVRLQGGWQKVSKLFGMSSGAASTVASQMHLEARDYQEHLTRSPTLQGTLQSPLSPHRSGTSAEQYLDKRLRTQERRKAEPLPRRPQTAPPPGARGVPTPPGRNVLYARSYTLPARPTEAAPPSPARPAGGPRDRWQRAPRSRGAREGTGTKRRPGQEQRQGQGQRPEQGQRQGQRQGQGQRPEQGQRQGQGQGQEWGPGSGRGRSGSGGLEQEEQLRESRRALVEAKEALRQGREHLWSPQGTPAPQFQATAQPTLGRRPSGGAPGASPGATSTPTPPGARAPGITPGVKTRAGAGTRAAQGQEGFGSLVASSAPAAAAALAAAAVAAASSPQTSLQARVRALESMLLSTRTALQEGRAALDHHQMELQKVQRDTIDELLRVQDSLEFRETEMERTRAELRSTKAEVTAMQGKLSAEFRETAEALEEKDQELQELRMQQSSLRLVRIVWPNEGGDIQIVGSFNGWTTPMRLSKSGAGVFATTLALYPGRYEIKFIVDGVWKVDPTRPIMYTKSGNENNILLVKQ